MGLYTTLILYVALNTAAIWFIAVYGLELVFLLASALITVLGI